MNAFMAVTIAILFLIGDAGLGSLAHLAIPTGLKPYNPLFDMILGILCVFLFAWPIYKRLGCLPPAPKCSNCHEFGAYERVSLEVEVHIIWRCQRCGQLIEMRGEEVFILDEDEMPVARLKLVSPKILGIWKRYGLD